MDTNATQQELLNRIQTLEQENELLRAGIFSQKEKHASIYKHLIENSTDVIWVTDLNLNFIYISRATEQLFGYSPQERKQLSLEQVFGTQNVKKFKEILQKEYTNFINKKTDNRFILDFQTKRKDGKRIWFEISASFITDTNGKPTAIYGISRDITQRKLAQKQLKESEANLQAIFNNTQQMFIMISADFKIITLNAIAKKYYKKINKIDIEPGDNFLTYIYPPHLQGFKNNFRKALNGESITIEKSLPYNNDLIYFNFSYNPVIEADKTINKVVFSVIDITEGKKAEKALIENNRHFSSLLKNPKQYAIFRLKKDVGTDKVEVIKISPSIKELIGLTEGDMYDFDKWFRFVHPDDLHAISQIFPKSISPPFKFDAQFRIIHPKKGIRWCHIHSSRIASKNEPEKSVYANGILLEITEQKAAEDALKESEKKFRTIINILPQMISYVDKDLRYQFVNKAYQDMFNVKPKDIIGHKIEDIIGEGTFKQARNHINRVLQGETVFYKEHFVYKNGKDVFIDGILIPKHDANQNIEGYYAVLTNTTDYVEANKQLKTSETRLALAVKSAAIGIWELDLTTNELHWDERMFELYGVENDGTKIIYETWLNALHPDCKKQAMEVTNLAIKGKKDYDTEFKIITPKNKIKDIKAYGLIIKNDAGKTEKMIGINYDITARKDMENNIARQQKQALAINKIFEFSFVTTNEEEIAKQCLDKLMDATNSKFGWIGELNKNNTLNTITFNNSFYDQNSISLDKKSHFLKRFQPDGFWKSVIQQNKPLIINTPENLSGELKLPEGHPQINCFVGIPLKLSKKPFGMMVLVNKPGGYDEADAEMIKNISSAIEIVFKKNRTELSLLKTNKKQKKLNKKLRKAKENAEESARLKTAFLNNISHEIRTPLNGIVGFAQILNKPELKPEQKEKYLKLITNSSFQLLHIVEDIITISQIQTGQILRKLFHVQLNKLILDQLEDHKKRALEKQIELSTKLHLTDKQDEILADRPKLVQILKNLIENAIKFTLEGSVEIGYMINDSYIKFYVKDTGIGIPEALQEKIFDQFWQAETGLSRQFGGTGLGLSICKAFVEFLGGKIWFESEVGKGTTFYFTIPYYWNSIQPSDYKHKLEISSFNWQNLHILVAEDEDLNFVFIEELLVDTGVHLHHVKNGLDAVAYCKTHDVDIVLMDIKMPFMNGYQATQEIKKINPNISVIAQTAYAFPEDEEKAREAGCSDFISKPLDEGKLKKIIQKNYSE